MSTELDYIGAELDVFVHATNWKRYWASVILPYLGERVLDVGAGIGATAKTLVMKSYERWVELEPDRAMCDRIREAQAAHEIPAHYEVKTGITKDLSESGSFDTVLYIDVLEHIEDDAAELVFAGDLLTSGGHIVVVAPAHNFLYTAFDKEIGHFRRYNTQSLIAATPPGFEIVKLCYLDSVGMLASLGNKLILQSGSPTVAQIKLWDRVMVPVSRCLDVVLLRKLGKSIVCVYQKLG